MGPVAIQIGDFTIRWYGIMVALGFLAGFLLVEFRARRSEQTDEKSAADMGVFGIVGAVLGARILYVIGNWSYFADKPLQMIRVDQGGLVFYGGLAGAAATVVLVARLKSCNIWAVADLFAPAVPLGHAIGRIGCFLNGCCFGKPYDGPLAMRYPPQAYQITARLQEENPLFSHAGQPVFPVQLLASAGNFVICAALLLVERAQPKHRRGMVIALYVTLYSAARFATEFFRGDYFHYYAGLTSAQWWCLVAFPIALGVFIWRFTAKPAVKA